MHFFTEEVRTTCTVCTCTHLYGKLKQIKTCYRLYFSFSVRRTEPYRLFEVRTDFLYTPRRSVIYESPIRHFKIQKVQGACHQPHRSPQRAHQGAVRQQPGYRHEPEPLQPPSGAAAGQVPGRSRPHDSRRPLPCPQGQRAGGGGSCHRQPGVFQGQDATAEIKAYFEYALKFLEGRAEHPDTFLSAVVHMDEKTPHLHLCFVPLTADGRLSAKEIIGNRKNLVKWQDEFWQHMVKQYPELERGESASQTGREHIPPRIFKEMTQLTKQKEQLDALLVGINPFNGKSRAAEISKVLDSYIPNVARMKDQLRKYNVAFTKTAAENEKLKEKNKTLSASLDKAKEGSVLKRLEDAKLRQDYEAALKTLDSIPPEVIRFYENRTQEPAMRHDK